jgi:hypothetical protein
MSDFWENVERFPRFFISSILGMILALIGPLFNLLKRPETTIILIVIILVSTFSVSMTLQAMLNIDPN